ncbi:MAG: hypothetical protein Q8Q09_21470 [Deltaproteobacteria bacterium]|nr:hypothetical protein [Deltaproteobacteria bacterium]
MLLFGGCPGPGGGDSGIPLDAVTDGASVGCVNDEVLDQDFDKRLDLDCVRMRAVLEARRTNEQSLHQTAMVSLMRTNQPHCCVSREQLVGFMRPQQGMTLPLTPSQQVAADRAAAMLLCDPLTREIQTRHYVAQHPTCLMSEVPGDLPPSDLPPSAPSGGAQ